MRVSMTWRTGAALAATVLAAVLILAPGSAAAASAEPVWLCKPGIAGDPAM